jgi:glycerate 2-kinase
MAKDTDKLIKGSFAEERADALSSIEAALKRIDPEESVKDVLKIYGDEFMHDGHIYRLNRFDHIYIIAFGKAAEGMTKAVLDVFFEIPLLEVTEVITVTKEFRGILPEDVKKIYGGHPLPNEDSLKAGREILKLAKKTTDNDLTFLLISGGGSAMVESPRVPLKDLQKATKLLMESGANIEELNTVRKHLSEIKGGGLLREIRGQVVSFIISDVIGDKLGVIASGPTYFDNSSFQDALDVIDKYYLKTKMPKSVLEVLENGAKGEILETLKENSPDMERVENILVATNFDACKVASAYLKSKGYSVIYLGSSIQGEAREVAKVFGGIAMDGGKGKLGVSLPVAVVFGGETTVTVKGDGIGGRNEELVLAIVPYLAETNAVFVSVGTDGIDGKSSAAGAIADSETLKKSQNKGLNLERFLANNDAHHFFNSLEDLIITGSTGTNVADIGVLIMSK